jgi:hypothetical protein
MAVDTKKVAGGTGLLLVSSVILLGTGVSNSIPAALVVVAALGMAAGALLLGTSEGGRPV